MDWSRTRAYGLGLNGLYLNLKRTRARRNCEPGPAAEALLKEIKDKLLAVRDPQNDVTAITRVDRASEVYQGPIRGKGPDLLVGYNRGYRAGWQTILGNFPAEVFENNTNPWSGDHCMDYTLVPGVLLSNRPIDAAASGSDRYRAHDLCAIWDSPAGRYDGTFSFFIHPLTRRSSQEEWRCPACPHKRSKSKENCWKRRRQCAEASGYASVDEFVLHTIEKEVKRLAPDEGGGTRVQRESDEAAARTRLHRVIAEIISGRVF